MIWGLVNEETLKCSEECVNSDGVACVTRQQRSLLLRHELVCPSTYILFKHTLKSVHKTSVYF